MKVKEIGDDVSGVEHAAAEGATAGVSWFPNGEADLTYTFDANGFTLNTSDEYALLPWSGADLGADGLTTAEREPDLTLENVKSVSFVGFEPSDWAQRVARGLEGQAVGSTFNLPVTLYASGALPSFLLDAVVGVNPDPLSERLGMKMKVVAKRLPDATVNGYEVCQFEYVMERPMMYDPAVVRTPGDHGQPPGEPLQTVQADIDAMVASIIMTGTVLSQADGFYRTLLEPYFPAVRGTFSTTSLVPYVPVELYMEHDYGISSQSNPLYDNERAFGASKATQPLSRPASQTFTYQP